MEKIENGVNPTNVDTPNKRQNAFNDLFADMLSYYVRNAKALSNDEKGDFARLGKANNAQSLKDWAENIHITGSIGDMTAIELANVIKNSDDNSLHSLLLASKDNPRVADNIATALTQQQSDAKAVESQNVVILFRNGDNNFSAIGKDVNTISNALGVAADSKINDLEVINVNKPGAFLLSQNDIAYKVVEPVVDFSFANGENNDISLSNKLMMQMGNIAVLSKGDTVRFDTQQQLFGNDLTLEVKKGLFSITQQNGKDSMLIHSVPIQQYDVREGKSTSYLYDMSAKELKNLQAFFNDNFDSLKQTTIDYANTRRALDDSLNSLITQNDRLAKENPDTIILIKQRGFIEAFSDSAINVAGTLGLQLYNRTNHKGDVSVPFIRMTVDDYKKLYDTDNNVYLARPSAQERMTDANLTKVNAGSRRMSSNTQQQEQQQENGFSFKR